MSGSTPVCQKGSVRKCLCRACKPHAKGGKLTENFFKHKITDCKCKLTEAVLARKPSLEGVYESNSKLQTSRKTSNSIKKCDCIACKPVVSRKRKRYCECENAKLQPTRRKKPSVLIISGGLESRQRLGSLREETVKRLNERLGERLLLDAPEVPPSDEDDFEITAKESSSFLQQKIDGGANVKTSDNKSILIKSENKDDTLKTAINKTKPPPSSSSDRNKSLSFSHEKVVVEFDQVHKRLLPFGNFFFELYYGKFGSKGEDSAQGKSQGQEEEEEEEEESWVDDFDCDRCEEISSRSPEKGKDPDSNLREPEFVSENKKDLEGQRCDVNIKKEAMDNEIESEKELRVKLPSKTAKETDPESELKVIKISDKSNAPDGETGERKPKYEKHDPNKMYYSKYITEYDSKRIVYGLHRLLHNYVLFRCEDRAITEGIISENFIEKLSEGFDMFLKNAYFYDPYYQPISFKRRYGYIELHLKVGVEDMFANKNRMFKKVFLVIFHRGSVKFILTKYNKPGRMIERGYNYGVNTKQCQDVWCRVDFITAIVNRRHRRVRHRIIETLYDILIADDKGFFRMIEPLEDLWVCIDFDTESESWSKTERTQFIKMQRRESDPYFKENLKYVDPLETQLEKERRRRKRKYKG